MAKVFRAMPVYVKNKKVAEIKEASVKVMTNGEQQAGFEAVLGESEGIVTVEGSFSEVIPVTGTEINILSILLAQGYAQIGVLVGGETMKMEAKFVDCEFKSTSKTGVVEGSFNWRSGAPQVI